MRFKEINLMGLDYKWRRLPKEKRGVLCGAEKTQEWMLPWWWSRYIEFNHLPVTFFDFGMTEDMRAWCQKRGEVITLDMDTSFVRPRKEIDPDLAKQWEHYHEWKVWDKRHAWFKKPFAFLNSSYEQGLWIDLDCEILGPLEHLFSQCTKACQIALVREYASDHLPKFDPSIRYNGGVIVFQHGAQIIEKWAETSVTLNHRFVGDDNVLSFLINQHQLDVVELPDIYNWRMVLGINLDAVVIHWVSSSKNYIRSHGGLKPSLDAFFQSCKGLMNKPTL
jgi:hypothetical protein